jgi:two-component system CheB/CheR fusion protein
VNGETNGIALPASEEPSVVGDFSDHSSESEARNHELAEANERLVVAMEELQSLNVALQSVNDALHTVNVELRGKLEALRETTLEVELMVNCIDVGAVLLSTRLEVRNFNATAARFLALGSDDVGKSLSRVRHDLGNMPIVELCRQALLTGDPVERISAASTGETIVVQAREVGVDSSDPGLMLTFTELKHALPQWESERA